MFYSPWALVMNPNGTVLYVADAQNYMIRQLVVASGITTTLAGGAGGTMPGYADGMGTAAMLNFPAGIAVNPAGSLLYFTDTNNNLLRQVSLPDCTVSLFAGGGSIGGTASGYADGIGTVATFSSPAGVIVGGSNLFVADAGSNRIRLVNILAPSATPSPAVVTASPTTTRTASRTATNSVAPLGPNVTTLVGGGTAGGQAAGTADGVGYAALFSFPAALAFDSSGTTMFVGDGNFNTGCIRQVVVTTATATTLAGNCSANGYADGAGANALFNNFGGLVVSPTDTVLYITDLRNNLIRTYSIANGTVGTLAGGGSTGGTASGATNGVGTAALFSYPTGVVVDPNGTLLYVTDNGACIRVVLIATARVTTLAGDCGYQNRRDGVGTLAWFKTPGRLTIDAAGQTLFVPDAVSNIVRQVVVATANVTTLAGGMTAGTNNGPGTTASFSYPTSVALDPSGTQLYVSDSNNNLIRQIDLSGGAIVSTIAGGGSVGGSVGGGNDGFGTAALFRSPQSIGVDHAGNLYIVDTSNNRIRVISLVTPSPVPPASASASPAGSGTPSSTETATASVTAVYSTTSTTESATRTPSETATVSLPAAASSSPSATRTATETATATESRTASRTPTETATASRTASVTLSAPPSLSFGASPTVTRTETATASLSSSPTVTGTVSRARTPSRSANSSAAAAVAASPGAAASLTPAGSVSAAPGDSGGADDSGGGAAGGGAVGTQMSILDAIYALAGLWSGVCYVLVVWRAFRDFATARAKEEAAYPLYARIARALRLAHPLQPEALADPQTAEFLSCMRALEGHLQRRGVAVAAGALSAEQLARVAAVLAAAIRACACGPAAPMLQPVACCPCCSVCAEGRSALVQRCCCRVGAFGSLSCLTCGRAGGYVFLSGPHFRRVAGRIAALAASTLRPWDCAPPSKSEARHSGGWRAGRSSSGGGSVLLVAAEGGGGVGGDGDDGNPALPSSAAERAAAAFHAARQQSVRLVSAFSSSSSPRAASNEPRTAQPPQPPRRPGAAARHAGRPPLARDADDPDAADADADSVPDTYGAASVGARFAGVPLHPSRSQQQPLQQQARTARSRGGASV